MEAIRLWLNGSRRYDTGAKLYTQYGNDKLLKRLFSESVTDYKQKRLVSVMEDLLANTAFVKAEKEVAYKKQIIRVIHEAQPLSGWSVEMDEVEQALHTHWKPLFAEMMDLESRVDDAGIAGEKDNAKKVEAGRMALRILELDALCDEFYSRREYYHEHKKLPDSKPYGDPCIDPKLMHKKLANAERYVREYKTILAKNAGDVNAANKLKEHEWFVAHYKNELNIK